MPGVKIQNYLSIQVVKYNIHDLQGKLRILLQLVRDPHHYFFQSVLHAIRPSGHGCPSRPIPPPLMCTTIRIRVRQNSLLHRLITVTVRTRQLHQHLTRFVIRDAPQFPIEMDERTWGATDDGTVWVRASLGVDAVFVLAFAVEVGREDGGFEACVGAFVVCIDERDEVFERRRCSRMGWY